MPDSLNSKHKEKSKMTIKTYLTDWLAEQMGRVKLRTYRRYQEIVKNNIAPILGEMSLQSLTPKDVRRFASRLLAEHADNTVLQIMGLLRRALQSANLHNSNLRVEPWLYDGVSAVSRRIGWGGCNGIAETGGQMWPDCVSVSVICFVLGWTGGLSWGWRTVRFWWWCERRFLPVWFCWTWRPWPVLVQ